MKEVSVDKILFRMINPYSKTSVWKNKNCEIGTIVVFVIILVIIATFLLNFSGVFWFKLLNPTYNYTTGCSEGRDGGEKFFANGCPVGHSRDTKEGRVICHNPYYTLEFIWCACAGLIPIFILVVVCFIVWLVLLFIRIMVVLMYELIIGIKNIFKESYAKSSVN